MARRWPLACYDTGYISNVKAMDYWLQLFGTQTVDASGNVSYYLKSSDSSLVTSILSAGTFIGALLAYPVGDRLGRRWGIQAFLVLFVIGVAMQTAATAIPLFAVGRVFAGFGVGGTSCLVPMYQSECAPKWIRGAVISGYQWMITIGLLIAAVVTNATKNRPDASCYRIPIRWSVFHRLLLDWYIMKGRDEDAYRSLARILSSEIDSPVVREEFAEIAANLHHERAVGATSYLDCFRSGPGRNSLRMWTGIGLQSLQQLTGINFIFYYGTTYFQNSGIANAFIITIATDVVNVGMTVPGIWAVDRYGRRSLLLIGAASMAISQLIVAIVGTVIGSGNPAGQKVLVAFVCIFIGSFAATWGPLAWVVTAEIYPLSIRAKAMSMSTAANWLLNLIIGIVTPYMVDSGAGNADLQSKVFFIWGGFCVICFLFVYFVIPETRGLKLEQVDLLYRNSSILGSNAYRKKLIDEDLHDEDKDAYIQPKNTAGSPVHEEKAERSLTE
ncbi:hypothetical protein MNV49_001932 [Pseudohyphozyma bogoriensis]|nr:hypothetical protein MNV49_001932 [Pseudohyphozyma bogoriensis]